MIKMESVGMERFGLWKAFELPHLFDSPHEIHFPIHVFVEDYLTSAKNT
jgi:hypothetical protein